MTSPLRSGRDAAFGRSASPSGLPIKVLIAEGDALQRRLIRFRLESANAFEISEAASRTEIQERLMESQPDVIVLGMNLTDAGGLSVLGQFHQNPITRSTPVIFLVDRGGGSAVDEALEAGAADYVARSHVDRLLISRIFGVLVPGPSAPAEARHRGGVSATAARQRPAKIGVEQAAHAATGATILVVEDTPIMRRILVRTLTKEGNNQIVEAESGAEAWRQISELRPHLIVLDINLPDIGGLELLAKIKQTPEIANIPVIMCTAHRDRASIEKAISLGAVDYIAKPVEMKTMMKKVEAALQAKI